VAAPTAVPADALVEGDLLAELTRRPEAMALIVANVGDGDGQVVLLPVDPDRDVRRAVVVDAATRKLLDVLDRCTEAGLLPGPDHPDAVPDVPLVVATHPHQDHIGQLAAVLDRLDGRVAAFWDPGYHHPTGAYHRMMLEVERRPGVDYAHPTAGFRRWIGRTTVTVLSPAVALRNRFDTYGVDVNDASISLRLEHPSARIVDRDDAGNVVDPTAGVAIVLGADAQTLSWSHVLTDFPYLRRSSSAAAAAIAAATGDVDLLRAQVFKVSHHASKRGVNLELLERIRPQVTIVSCGHDSPRYHFPHDVAQALLREAREPVAGSGGTRETEDWQLRIVYTSDRDDAGTVLGSVVAVVEPGRRPQVWRTGDDVTEPFTLDHLTRCRRMRG
jgi:hypothetical protein